MPYKKKSRSCAKHSLTLGISPCLSKYDPNFWFHGSIVLRPGLDWFSFTIYLEIIPCMTLKKLLVPFMTLEKNLFILWPSNQLPSLLWHQSVNICRQGTLETCQFFCCVGQNTLTPHLFYSIFSAPTLFEPAQQRRQRPYRRRRRSGGMALADPGYVGDPTAAR